MRLSVRENDPGFSDKCFGAKVFVDGKEVSHCFTADEETGKAYCYAEDENGNLYIDPDNPDCVKEITLTGTVRIFIPRRG